MDASDWVKGIFFSVLASVIGAGSKLAIRKSWLMEQDSTNNSHEQGTAYREYQEPSLQATGSSNNISANPNEPVAGRERGRATSNSTTSISVRQKQPRQPQPPQPARRRADSRSYYTAIQSHGDRSPPNSPVRLPEEDGTIIVTEESVLEMEATPIPSRCCCCCTLPWFLRFSGMIGMTFLNPACCLLAMNYATPSILAPFSGLTLVWVIVLSQPLIGESPSCAQRVASTLIVIGEVMVAVFGDHSNGAGTTIADVVASYKEPSFIVFFVLSALWMILLCLWMKFSKSPTLKRFAWGTSGGSITGLAQNFIKDSLVVVKATSSLGQLPWYVYLFVFNGIAFSFGGLLFLTACMKRYDATYSAAMFVGSFVVSTSIMAASHYHTFEHLTDVVDYIMYPMGLVILMLGVCMLVQATQAYNVQSDPDDSNRIILAGDRYGEDESSGRGDGCHHDDTDDDATPVAASATSAPSTDLSEMASKATETTIADSTHTGDSQTSNELVETV